MIFRLLLLLVVLNPPFSATLWAQNGELLSDKEVKTFLLDKDFDLHAFWEHHALMYLSAGDWAELETLAEEGSTELSWELEEHLEDAFAAVHGRLHFALAPGLPAMYQAISEYFTISSFLARLKQHDHLILSCPSVPLQRTRTPQGISYRSFSDKAQTSYLFAVVEGERFFSPAVKVKKPTFRALKTIFGIYLCTSEWLLYPARYFLLGY